MTIAIVTGGSRCRRPHHHRRRHGSRARTRRRNTASFPAFARDVGAALDERWGQTSFDNLVNNAGYGLYDPIATVTEAQADGLFNVHLKGPFFFTQALLPLMADGGHIVNLTSATTRVATAGVAPYASFKGGL